MLGDGVASSAEYLGIGGRDLGERVGGELLHADPAFGRDCLQPGQDFGRHLNAQGHASSVSSRPDGLRWFRLRNTMLLCQAASASWGWSG